MFSNIRSLGSRLTKWSIGLFFSMMNAVVFAQVKINDLRGTSGAGNKTVDTQLTRYNETLQVVLNFTFAIFTLAGVICVGAALLAWHKASKREEDAPKSAKVGLLVGIALTVLGLIIGYGANTLAS